MEATMTMTTAEQTGSDGDQNMTGESRRDHRLRLKRKSAKRRRGTAPKGKAKLPTVEVDGITTRAMLVGLTLCVWEGRKLDKTTTREVLADARAVKDAGVWWTRLIPPSAYKPIAVAVSRARWAYIARTMPWANEGPRVLPAEMYFDYTAAMREVRAEFEAAVETFLAEYPNIVADAPARLGRLMPDGVFPTVEELRTKFTFKTSVSPLPTAGDFRVDLGDEATAEIRKSIEAASKASMAQAMGDLWNRLHDGVSKIAERLSDPKGIFRDSLIENVAELCELLPKMNVTGDDGLEAMRQAVVAKLAGQDPETLRSNKSARSDAASQAKDILDQMGAFMGAGK